MKLYLTFDDGPSGYTCELLDLLKEYNVKATFFLVGSFALAHPEAVKREIAEGHAFGIHSYSHINALYMTHKFFCEDMDRTLEAVRSYGIEPKLYRPPWGIKRIFSEKESKKRGLRLVKWDVMAEDWRANITSEEIARRLLKRASDGAVICIHDGRGRNEAPKRTIEALKIALPVLIERGYVFETMQ